MCFQGPPTKRPVTKRPVTKRPFTKRPVTKDPDYQTSRLPNVQLPKVQITKRPVCQTSSYQISSYRTSILVIITKHSFLFWLFSLTKCVRNIKFAILFNVKWVLIWPIYALYRYIEVSWLGFILSTNIRKWEKSATTRHTRKFDQSYLTLATTTTWLLITRISGIFWYMVPVVFRGERGRRGGVLSVTVPASSSCMLGFLISHVDLGKLRLRLAFTCWTKSELNTVHIFLGAKNRHSCQYWKKGKNWMFCNNY
jgi:hypothetical protein